MEMLLGLYVAGGLLLAVLSVPMIMRRLPPNGLYGFRVPRTLNNPDIWYDANAYAGKRLLVAGLGAVLAAVVLYFVPNISLDAYALACAAVILGVLAVVLIQSLRYLYTLPSGRRDAGQTNGE